MSWGAIDSGQSNEALRGRRKKQYNRSTSACWGVQFHTLHFLVCWSFPSGDCRPRLQSTLTFGVIASFLGRCWNGNDSVQTLLTWLIISVCQLRIQSRGMQWSLIGLQLWLHVPYINYLCAIAVADAACTYYLCHLNHNWWHCMHGYNDLIISCETALHKRNWVGFKNWVNK